MLSQVIQALPRVPLTCFWEITEACNLRCIHCEADAGHAAADELSTEAALHLAQELAEARVEAVCLTGGEPLLRRDWPHIAHELSALGISVTVISNGTLVDRAMVNRMLEAGVTGLSVSLDGERAVHDAIRLPVHPSDGSRYDAALGAIRCAVSSPLKVAVITQIHSKNVGELRAMYEMLVSLGVAVWQVQLCMPLGRMPRLAPDYLVTPAALPALEQELAELIGEGRLRIAVGDNIGYYGRHEPTLRGSVRNTSSFWLGCLAGCRVVALCANGDVKGCPSHPRSWVAGNVLCRPFREIWADRAQFFYNTLWDEDKLTGACRLCEYRRLCRAGCTSMAYATTRGFYENPYCLQQTELGLRTSSRAALSGPSGEP
jgi:radical SAM protein with 4Fe4S-binding SPASM domain